MAKSADKSTTVTIVAQAGWFLAVYIKAGTFHGKDYPESFSYHPIIAWEIERTEEAISSPVDRPNQICRTIVPITVDFPNIERLGNHFAIKSPDGAYSYPGDTVLKNEQEALDFQKVLEVTDA
jgi:hypothetical protein